jgi:hypothetical protein
MLNFMLPVYRPNFGEVARTRWKIEQAWCSMCAVTLFLGWTWFQSCLEYLAVLRGFKVFISAHSHACLNESNISVTWRDQVLSEARTSFLVCPHYINNGILIKRDNHPLWLVFRQYAILWMLFQKLLSCIMNSKCICVHTHITVCVCVCVCVYVYVCCIYPNIRWSCI